MKKKSKWKEKEELIQRLLEIISIRLGETIFVPKGHIIDGRMAIEVYHLEVQNNPTLIKELCEFWLRENRD